MWQELFHRQHTRTRLADGPWGMYLEEFATTLAQHRYSVETVRRSLYAADHFGRWLLGQDFTLADVDEGKLNNTAVLWVDALRVHGLIAHTV